MADLLAIVEPDREARERTRATLQRRIGYLLGRAAKVRTRGDDGTDPARPPWHDRLVAANLYLEVAEILAVLGDHVGALEGWANASGLYLQAGLPFGAALQRAFLPGNLRLAVAASVLQSEWSARDRSGPDASANDEVDRREVPRSRESSAQWAYFVLAEALGDGDRGPAFDEGREPTIMAGLEAIAVGRLDLPYSAYALVAGFVRSLVPFEDRHDEEREIAVAQVFGATFERLFIALDTARADRYRWERMLAPTPFFDTDMAILLGPILGMPGPVGKRIKERISRTLDREAARYADACFATLEALRPGRDRFRSD